MEGTLTAVVNQEVPATTALVSVDVPPTATFPTQVMQLASKACFQGTFAQVTATSAQVTTLTTTECPALPDQPNGGVVNLPGSVEIPSGTTVTIQGDTQVVVAECLHVEGTISVQIAATQPAGTVVLLKSLAQCLHVDKSQIQMVSVQGKMCATFNVDTSEVTATYEACPPVPPSDGSSVRVLGTSVALLVALSLTL